MRIQSPKPLCGGRGGVVLHPKGWCNTQHPHRAPVLQQCCATPTQQTQQEAATGTATPAHDRPVIGRTETGTGGTRHAGQGDGGTPATGGRNGRLWGTATGMGRGTPTPVGSPWRPGAGRPCQAIPRAYSDSRKSPTEATDER